MPAHIADQRRALADEAFAVIDEQSHVELRSGQLGDRQRVEAFAQRRPGDRDGADDVRLAALARRRADAGHQLRRDAHDLLATLKQEPLKRAGDVAAILDRPHPLSVKAAGPDEQIANERRLALTVLSATA
jgi:hypothetical protein